MTTISLVVLDDDPAAADRLSRELRTELLVLDIDSGPGAGQRGPTERETDAGTITAIVVALSGSPVLVQLGLSIVRAVARAHGGQAQAQSRDGGGLIVTVALPSAGDGGAVGTAG